MKIVFVTNRRALLSDSYQGHSEGKCQSLSRVWLFAIPWTVAHQAPLSMGFSRQEYWNGLQFPSPGDPNPRDQNWVSDFAADSLPSETWNTILLWARSCCVRAYYVSIAGEWIGICRCFKTLVLCEDVFRYTLRQPEKVQCSFPTHFRYLQGSIWNNYWSRDFYHW